MSNFTQIQQESFVEERKQVTLPQKEYQKHINFGIKKENRIHIKVQFQAQIINCKHNRLPDNLYSQVDVTRIINNNVILAVNNNKQLEKVRSCIKASWRDKVLYLQFFIAEFEKKKEVQIVKEVDNTRIIELEAENERLRILIEKIRSEVITQRIQEVNNEAEGWKRKFQEINHDYSETQEKLMNAEIELEALKKQKIVTTNKFRFKCQIVSIWYQTQCMSSLKSLIKIKNNLEMQTPEPQTIQYKFRSRSRDTSKLKLMARSTTDSSSSSSNSSSSSSSSSSGSSSGSSSSSGCHFHYQIGDKIDKYLITQYLCSGTFGIVLEVIDELANTYAVKVIRLIFRS
ncbi:unnamed protein product [Paramecium sonneborni]|uniref:Uncharacterized protein n=1 Tax=Paramecium sonneborni TaxID=65129 RepID=A0A8S1NWL1_9CILI|nr:unnamed protein product [Paramecium sonneborni]